MTLLDRKIAPSIQPLKNFNLQKIEPSKLSNGIPVFTLNAGTLPVIRLEIIFQAGVRHEAINGASYFVSKMLQEGTRSHSAKEISEKIASLGAFLEVSHNVDRTIITFFCLTKTFEQLLPVVYEMLALPTFPEDQLENLKNIVQQSIKVNLEKNSYVAANLLKEQLYPNGHPYGKTLNLEDIPLITKGELERFFKHQYQFSKAEIVISGQVGSQELFLLNRYFGNEKFELGDTHEIPVTNLGRPQNKLIEKQQSVQSSIRIGKRLFTRSHPDYFKMVVANEILGGYFGSRLMKNIREDKGFTYGINSHMSSHQDEGYFVISTDVKKEFTSAAIDEILKEINILRTQPVPEDELHVVKNYMHGSFLGSINTPFSLADKFKTIHFAGLDYDYFDKYLQTLQNISANQILEISQKYLNDFVEVVVGGRE